MLAYETHVVQSCANINIKPMPEESSLFSQYDPSCSLFFLTNVKLKKKVKNKMTICN